MNILLVEDNPGDVRLMREIFREEDLRHVVHVVEDGLAAMMFLRHEPPYNDSPRPELVILDLNLPRKDGREVLAEMKSDPELESIPVLVLTSSESEQDILRVQQLKGESYVTKPENLDLFFKQIFAMTHDIDSHKTP